MGHGSAGWPAGKRSPWCCFIISAFVCRAPKPRLGRRADGTGAATTPIAARDTPRVRWGVMARERGGGGAARQCWLWYTATVDCAIDLALRPTPGAERMARVVPRDNTRHRATIATGLVCCVEPDLTHPRSPAAARHGEALGLGVTNWVHHDARLQGRTTSNKQAESTQQATRSKRGATALTVPAAR
eukprot:300571-Chlamydomonas_euryale.AAC.7